MKGFRSLKIAWLYKIRFDRRFNESLTQPEISTIHARQHPYRATSPLQFLLTLDIGPWTLDYQSQHSNFPAFHYSKTLIDSVME